jgi:hypothetical protein
MNRMVERPVYSVANFAVIPGCAPWRRPGMITVKSVLLLPRLRAETLLLLAQFGRQCLAEILGVEDLPDFDLGAVIERRPLHPFDRLVQRFDLDQPETGNQIAGKAERTAT